jgi:hypothetical protein
MTKLARGPFLAASHSLLDCVQLRLNLLHVNRGSTFTSISRRIYRRHTQPDRADNHPGLRYKIYRKSRFAVLLRKASRNIYAKGKLPMPIKAWRVSRALRVTTLSTIGNFIVYNRSHSGPSKYYVVEKAGHAA